MQQLHIYKIKDIKNIIIYNIQNGRNRINRRNNEYYKR